MLCLTTSNSVRASYYSLTGNLNWATHSLLGLLCRRTNFHIYIYITPTSSFFEGLSDQIKLFYGQGEPEVTQPVQEEAGGQFIGPHAPSSQFLAKRIPLVLRGCQHIAVRKDFLTTIFEDLHLFQASPRKRLKIAEILNIIEENQDVFLKLYENPKSQGGAGHYLMVVVHDWEREQELA